MTRDFQKDFAAPAIRGLNPDAAKRVALALDIAIAFGALERAQGNKSLSNIDLIEQQYAEKVARLARLVK